MQPFDPISNPGASSPELPTQPIAPLKIVLEPEPPPPPPIVIELPKTDIDLLDVLFILLAAAAASIFCGLVGGVILMVANHGRPLDAKALETNVFFILPVEFAIYAAVLGFTALLVWVRHRRQLFDAVSWNWPDRKLAMFAGLTGFGLSVVSLLGGTLLNRWIPKSLPMSDYFKDRPSALLLAAFAVLVAPFMEELFFRGVLYPAVAKWTGPAISVLFTALAFTALHGAQLSFSWAALTPIFIVGLTLTIVRASKKSLATCVLIHMTYNFVLMVEAYIASNGFRDMKGM